MSHHALDRCSNPWRQAAAPASAGAPLERSWRNARSLEELKIHLVGVEQLNPTPDEIENLRKLFMFSALRPNLQTVFMEMATELWELAGNTEWMREISHSMPADTLVWHDAEVFMETAKKLPAKKLPAWFDASREARGRDWLISLTLQMPVRYWSPIEAALAKHEGDGEILYLAALEQLRKGTASADTVIWLWKKKDKRSADAFANPQAIFRIIGTEVRGEYIKSRKELLKQLMEKPDFQLALMHGGTPEGIETFVKVVKHLPLLNKGEQQSLLVKILRQYPAAKELIEDKRSEGSTRRHMPKLTSRRTYEAHRAELRDIINKRIPENTASIATARDYGDLRENFEFKAAKENQRLLMTRRAELERSLSEVQPTDYVEVNIGERVVPGTSVELTMENGKTEIYHVLGLWDSVPERRILSYETPLGKVLISKAVGEVVETPQGPKATITAIRNLPKEIMEWARGEEG